MFWVKSKYGDEVWTYSHYELSFLPACDPAGDYFLYDVASDYDIGYFDSLEKAWEFVEDFD